MRDQRRNVWRCTARVAAWVGIIACASSAWADVIWVGSGAGRGLRQEVDIIGVEADLLVYLVNGNRGTTPLGRIQQIGIDGETGFNDAEQAFSSGDWARAAENYRAAARGHPEDWVRRRAAERLILAGSRAGRFDQAVTGYIQLTLVAPSAAAGREPVAPEEVPGLQLAGAAAELQEALTDELSLDQQRPLLALLLHVHNRRGDDEAAATVVERLGRVMGPDAADEDPELFAQVLLGRANLALKRDQHSLAQRLVNQGSRVLVSPRHQSEALMILARAEEAMARDDPARLMDAAVAYMKVVTFFKRYGDIPHVPEALYRVGQIHERLGLPEPAADLYRDIVGNYPGTPAAAQARERLASLPQ